MLGLSSGLIKGASTLRSIFKSGLQAWYKADKTQAPLGEERIENSDFNIGPELFVNGGFTKDGTLSNTSALAGGIDWNLPDVNPTSYSASISNNSLTIVVTDHTASNVGRAFGNTNETYYRTVGVGFPTDSDFVLTYTVESVTGDIAASGEFKVFTGDNYTAIPRTVGTHTEYFTFGGAAGPRTNIAFKLDGANGSITISNVSIRRVNHGKLATGNLLPSTTNLSNWQTSGSMTDDSGNTVTSVSISGGGILVSVPDTDDDNSLGDFSYFQQTEANADWNYDVECEYLIRASILPGAGADGKQIRFQDSISNIGGLVKAATTTTLAHDDNGNGVMKHVQFIWTPNANSNTIVVARETSNTTAYNFTIKELKMYKLNPYSWTNGGGWQIKDGFAECVSDNNDLEVFIDAETNREYQVEFDILSRTSGGLVCDINNGTDGTPSGGGTFNSVGHHKVIIKAPNSLTDKGKLRFFGGSFRGTIGNISCRAITNSVKDFSNNRNDARLYSGTALHFDGTNDYIRILNKPVVSGTTVTAAFWIKPNTSNNSAIVLSNGQSGVAGWYIWQDGADIKVALNNASESTTKVTYASTNFYTNNVWQRVVVVIPPDGNISYYKDGELVEIESINYNWTPARSTENFVIGGYDNLAAIYAFDGQLADVQIYDKLWTASDVEFDYNNPDKDVFDDEGRVEVLSSELITNGTFDNDLSSWIISNDGAAEDSITWDNGRAKIIYDTDGTDAALGLSQQILTVGKHYRCSIDVEAIQTGHKVKVFTGVDQVSPTGHLGTGSHSFVFKATHQNFIIYREMANVDTEAYVDNVSVKEITTHAGEISPTNCKALYRLNEGAGNRLYDAAPVLGEELNTLANPTSVTNESSNIETSSNGVPSWTHNHITSDSSVTNNSNFSIKFQSTAGGNRSYMDLNEILTIGKLYKLQIDVRHIGSGDDFILQFNELNSLNVGSYQRAIATITSSDTDFVTYTQTFIHDASTRFFGVKENGTNDNAGGYIDNLTIKEITPATSVAQTSWVASNWITAQPYIPQYAMSSYSNKLVFDGVADNINCGSDTSLDDVFTDGGTWSCWISPNNFGEASNPDIMVKGNVRIRVASDSGNPIIRFLKSFSVDNGNWRTDDTITFSKLTHVAVAYNSNSNEHNPDIYVNGVKQNITESAAPSGTASSDASSDLYIGGAGAGGNNNYEGFVDEVSIFDKKLTEAEVQEIFNAGTALDIRNHSCYLSNELVVNSDFSEGVQGDGLPNNWEHHAQNTSTAEVGTFKGKDNVVKIVTQGDGLSQSKLAQNFTFRNSTKYQVEIEVFIESGRFKFDTEDSNFGSSSDILTDDNDSERGYWRTIKHTFTTKSTAESSGDHLFLRSPNSVASVIYINKVSVKRYDVVSYWRNNGLDTWTDLSVYENDGTHNNDLVANGNFESAESDGSCSNWTALSDATNTQQNVAGSNAIVVQVDPPATGDNYGLVNQVIDNLVIGDEYVVSANIISATYRAELNLNTAPQSSSTSRVQFQCGAGQDSFGVKTATFTAQETTLYMQLRTIQASNLDDQLHNAVYDNVSIKRVADVIKLQEVPLFNKDSLSLPMNKVRQKGFNLDGYGYVKVDDSNTLGTLAGGFTCAFWYRHAENIDNNNYYYLVNKGRGLGTDVDGGFGTAVYNNIIFFDFNTSVQRYSLQHSLGAASSSSPVWYYITVTYNGSNECVLYVNAEARNTISNVSGSVSDTAEARAITIGTTYDYDSHMARTVLDEVKFYNIALSPSQIKRNFNFSKSKHSSVSNWSDDFSSDFI